MLTINKKLILHSIAFLLMCITMKYKLTGATWHEILGTTLIGYMIIHNLWCWRWYKNLFRGPYSKKRMLSTVINLAMLVSVIIFTVAIELPHGALAPYGISTKTLKGVHKFFADAFFGLLLAHLALHWKIFYLAWQNRKRSTR